MSAYISGTTLCITLVPRNDVHSREKDRVTEICRPYPDSSFQVGKLGAIDSNRGVPRVFVSIFAG